MQQRDFNTCPTCIDDGIQGSCARLRCYCGHKDCPAYASYINRDQIQATVPKRATRKQTEKERTNRYK